MISRTCRNGTDTPGARYGLVGGRQKNAIELDGTRSGTTRWREKLAVRQALPVQGADER
jgi:hypothetical protein